MLVLLVRVKENSWNLPVKYKIALYYYSVSADGILVKVQHIL